MIDVVSHLDVYPEARMATPLEAKCYLDIRELSARSGLSVTTLRRYARDGKIESLQPGGPGSKLLFRPDALERCTTPPAGIGPQAAAPQSCSDSKRLPGRKPTWMAPPADPPPTPS